MNFADVKIAVAVKKFGWNNEQKAKLFLGQNLWKIVVFEGGWVRLCATQTSESRLEKSMKRWRLISNSIAA